MAATPTPGLRERKKAQTRAGVAAAAARLFAEHGFHPVTMVEIARAAEVSEQTVYNYFPTKEALVFDRADELQQALLELVADRDPGTDLLDAYAGWLRATILGSSARRATRHAGGMPRLVATDTGLRRHLLDYTDRMASTLADRITAHEGVDPVTARTLTDALLQVFVRAVDRLGLLKTEAQLDALQADTHQALDTLRPAFAALHRAQPSSWRLSHERLWHESDGDDE
jgi:AcrR family transcriptional regulator